MVRAVGSGGGHINGREVQNARGLIKPRYTKPIAAYPVHLVKSQRSR